MKDCRRLTRSSGCRIRKKIAKVFKSNKQSTTANMSGDWAKIDFRVLGGLSVVPQTPSEFPCPWTWDCEWSTQFHEASPEKLEKVFDFYCISARSACKKSLFSTLPKWKYFHVEMSGHFVRFIGTLLPSNVSVLVPKQPNCRKNPLKDPQDLWAIPIFKK